MPSLVNTAQSEAFGVFVAQKFLSSFDVSEDAFSSFQAHFNS